MFDDQQSKGQPKQSPATGAGSVATPPSPPKQSPHSDQLSVPAADKVAEDMFASVSDEVGTPPPPSPRPPEGLPESSLEEKKDAGGDAIRPLKIARDLDQPSPFKKKELGGDSPNLPASTNEITPPVELKSDPLKFGSRRTILIVVIAIVALGLGVGAWWIWGLNRAKPIEEDMISQTEERGIEESKTEEGGRLEETFPAEQEERATFPSEDGEPVVDVKEPEFESVFPDLPPDSDADGLTDAEEKLYGSNINSSDTDGDGLYDREEVKVWKTDPTLSDTDGDGYMDGEEVAGGYNPNGLGRLQQIPR